MPAKLDKKELWVNWARDAVRTYAMPEDMNDADNEELAEDISEFASAVADKMLEAYEETFDSKPAGGGRRRRRAEEEEEPD